MLRFIKYRNYKTNLLRFILFIFLCLIYLYVYPSKNVTFQKTVFNSTILKFNLPSISSYSITYNLKKKYFVGTDKGILIFNGFNWKIHPCEFPVFDLIASNDTLISLSLKGITYWNIKEDDINPINNINLSQKIDLSGLNTPKLLFTNNLLYVFSQPQCFCLVQDSIIPIRTQLNDVLVHNKILYGITNENVVIKINGPHISEIDKIGQSFDAFKFLATDSNLLLVSDKILYSLNPLIKGSQKEITISKPGINFQNIFALSNHLVYFSHTANYFYTYNLKSDKFYQLPIINPFITKYTDCLIDADKNLWLLYDEGIIMLSQIQNPEVFPKGEFEYLTGNAEKDNIASQNQLIFIFEKPFYLSSFAYVLYIILGSIVIFILIFSWKFRSKKDSDKLEQIIKERTAEIIREKDKTDELIANLLPKDTVTELKNTGKATSQKFEMVTVLFSDIQGFTKIAEQLNPEKLIDQLDNFFFHFDSVVEKYNIEKIKTIGDAYMCAGGIPYKNRTNPVEVVLSALEMQDYMRQLKSKDQNFWDLRIGIHTGAVISGVVGHKRLSYDIWGDTVNTASRMESSGEAGKINISGHTYELVKDFFICEYRGKMPVKYKGDIDMYFVKGIRPELSVDLKVIPNRKFFIQLQLLRLLDLEEFIYERMNQEMTYNYFFHSAKHTKDVYTQTELIGRAEGLSPEEMLLTRTTSLLLDIGFISDYHNHINHSVNFTREILPKFKYSTDQIEIICNLLYAANTENNNPSLIESIIIDARYNYFGRVDYIDKILELAREIKAFVPSFNTKDFLLLQKERLKKFTFLTETGRLLQEIPPVQQIKKLEEIMKLKELN